MKDGTLQTKSGGGNDENLTGLKTFVFGALPRPSRSTERAGVGVGDKAKRSISLPSPDLFGLWPLEALRPSFY